MVELELSRLLAPRSVVVVGATDRAGSYAAQTLLNLRRAGFPGPVFGVHPHRSQVLGARCSPTLDDVADQLGMPPDAVVIATPAATVAGYLTAAGRIGAGGAVVYAAGFGESGDRTGQREVVAAAARYGLPVLGPNANGFVSVGARTPLWGDAVTLPERAGPIALITQSGNLGVLALAHRAGLGLHTVVSLGNAAVLDAPAVLRYLAQTDGVRAVALYLEDDGDGARLADALAVAVAGDVRIVVLKAGRSAAGRQAVGAHTAALAGDHRVFAALIEEAGGVLARDPHDLLETARALATGRRMTGRLAVLTASGGDAAIAADLAADAGLPLAELTAATRTALAELLPHTATVTNPLDHTNLVWADTQAIAAITAALAADPDIGPVLYVQDQPPGLPPADAAEWAATRAGAVLGGQRAGIETLLVATMPGQEPPADTADLRSSTTTTPGRRSASTPISGLRSALTALTALRRPAPQPARLLAIAAAARRRSTTSPGAWLAEHEAKAVLAAAGVPVPPHVVLPLDCLLTQPTRATDFVLAHQESGVAAKLSAPGLLHKSEARALALNLRDGHQLTAAISTLLAGTRDPLPGSRLLIERMAAPGVELLIAAVRDGVVPALLIGLGGIWAESLDDVVLLPLPAEPDRVVAALTRLRAAPLLTGGRGRPPVDLAAIGHIAYQIGDVLLTGGFSLIEVNPLIVSAGAVAVDALARH